MSLRYEKITKDNINIAAKIQFEIFPFSSGYTKYLNEIKNNKDLPIDFLFYYQNKPIGVIGLYQYDKKDDSIWVSYFGLLEKYRKKGYGKQMFDYIISLAKNYNKKYLRLYTYEVWNNEAQNFYKKHMEFEEYYTNPDDDQTDIKEGICKIFSYSLHGDKIIPWNNKYIGLKEDDKEHLKSIKKMKEDNLL